MQPPSVEQIDSLLPQTQCGLCGYGGCLPYAKAIAKENAPIYLCPPGGVKTLYELGAITKQDPTPFIAQMEKSALPRKLAVIREDECIGCVKCIKACPVDAIIGTAKQMHTIVAQECTGCELCVPACPVDCIDMLVLVDQPPFSTEEDKKMLAKIRFNAKQQRLIKEETNTPILQTKKTYVLEAVKRAKVKRMLK